MSYDPAEPTERDIVRGLLGDTTNDPTTERLADATIDAVLTRYASVKRAAAECARRLGSLARRRPESMTIGGATVTRGQRPADWEALATALEAQADDEDARTGGLFDWAEQVPDLFSARERRRNEALRELGS